MQAFQSEGARPLGADDPDAFLVRAVSLTLPVAADWLTAAAEPMTARLGKDFGYTP